MADVILALETLDDDVPLAPEQPRLAPPTHGCMTCKAQTAYTVEHFPTGNTGWRCVVCHHISRLIPGRLITHV
jgi:hypothetical protein